MTVAGANVAYVFASLAVLVMFWSKPHPVGRGSSSRLRSRS